MKLFFLIQMGAQNEVQKGIKRIALPQENTWSVASCSVFASGHVMATSVLALHCQLPGAEPQVTPRELHPGLA